MLVATPKQGRAAHTQLVSQIAKSETREPWLGAGAAGGST